MSMIVVRLLYFNPSPALVELKYPSTVHEGRPDPPDSQRPSRARPAMLHHAMQSNACAVPADRLEEQARNFVPCVSILNLVGRWFGGACGEPAGVVLEFCTLFSLCLQQFSHAGVVSCSGPENAPARQPWSQ
jgi:hypothetical protein